MHLTEEAVRDLVPVRSKTQPQRVYWDTELAGFGLLIGRGGTKTFVVQKYNIRKKIGNYGPVTDTKSLIFVVDRARKEAEQAISELDTKVRGAVPGHVAAPPDLDAWAKKAKRNRRARSSAH